MKGFVKQLKNQNKRDMNLKLKNIKKNKPEFQKVKSLIQKN